MRIICLFISVFCFCLIGNSQKYEFRKDFYRLELNSRFSTIMILKEGVLCEILDSPFPYNYEFINLEELDIDKYNQLQHEIKKIKLFEYDSIIENPNIKNYDIELILYVFNPNLQVNKIHWLSGEDKGLTKIIKLVGECIPAEKREKYWFPKPME